MGVKSTYLIGARTAKEVIKNKLNKLNERQLSIILDMFDESEYRNYIVKQDLNHNELKDKRTITHKDQF